MALGIGENPGRARLRGYVPSDRRGEMKDAIARGAVIGRSAKNIKNARTERKEAKQAKGRGVEVVGSGRKGETKPYGGR